MKRVQHHWAKRKLGPYVDDELALGEVERVSLHLPDCPECAAHTRWLLRVQVALQHARRSALNERSESGASSRLR